MILLDSVIEYLILLSLIDFMKTYIFVKRIPLLILATAIMTGVILASLSSGSPEIFSPLSILFVFPMFMEWKLHTLILIPILAFIFFNSPFLSYDETKKGPLLQKILIVITIFLSAYWFAISAKYGLRYQGWIHYSSTLLIGIGFALSLLFLIRYYEKMPNWKLFLLNSTLLFIWLFAYAFPYLGELP